MRDNERKTYEKPVLVKAGTLSTATAQANENGSRFSQTERSHSRLA